MTRAKLLPYAGGKRRLTSRLLALMPSHECYVDSFVGGGGLTAAKDPAQSSVEVINDIDRQLVGLYRVAKYHPEALQVECALILRSRADYADFRVQEGLTDTRTRPCAPRRRRWRIAVMKPPRNGLKTNETLLPRRASHDIPCR